MTDPSSPDIDTAAALPPDLSLAALFLRFLKFGALAFGGPVAQIAMIRRELVEEERWISGDRFNKLLAVMQVLPGPEAHELCVHLGVRARGRVGGLLAGVGFMLPGLVLMLGLAWLYSRLPIQGTLLGAMFLGVQAAVIAVIVRAVHRIGGHILVDPWLWGAAGLAVLATLGGVSFWIVLPTMGVAYALASTGRLVPATLALLAAALLAAWIQWGLADPPVVGQSVAGQTPTTAALFLAGLKGGLLTFGGAYTAIPFIRADTVGRGWATDAQFLDGVGLSSILPAPLVIFATFVGWVSGGLWGALAMTAGMFLPAFAFSLIFYERLEALVEDPRLHRFLAGVAAGVVGLIGVTALELGRSTVARTPDVWISATIFVLTLVVLYLWKSKMAAPALLGASAVAGALLLG